MEKDIKEQLEKLQYYGEFYAKSDIDDKIKLEELDKTGEISEFGRNFSPQVDHKYSMVVSNSRAYLLANGKGGRDFESFLKTFEKLNNDKYKELVTSFEYNPAKTHLYTHRGDLLEAFGGVYDEEVEKIGTNFGEVYKEVNETIKNGSVNLSDYPDLERAFSDYELKLLDKEVWEMEHDYVKYNLGHTFDYLHDKHIFLEVDKMDERKLYEIQEKIIQNIKNNDNYKEYSCYKAEDIYSAVGLEDETGEVVVPKYSVVLTSQERPDLLGVSEYPDVNIAPTLNGNGEINLDLKFFEGKLQEFRLNDLFKDIETDDIYENTEDFASFKSVESKANVKLKNGFVFEHESRISSMQHIYDDYNRSGNGINDTVQEISIMDDGRISVKLNIDELSTKDFLKEPLDTFNEHSKSKKYNDILKDGRESYHDVKDMLIEEGVIDKNRYDELLEEKAEFDKNEEIARKNIEKLIKQLRKPENQAKQYEAYMNNLGREKEIGYVNLPRVISDFKENNIKAVYNEENDNYDIISTRPNYKGDEYKIIFCDKNGIVETNAYDMDLDLMSDYSTFYGHVQNIQALRSNEKYKDFELNLYGGYCDKMEIDLNNKDFNRKLVIENDAWNGMEDVQNKFVLEYPNDKEIRSFNGIGSCYVNDLLVGRENGKLGEYMQFKDHDHITKTDYDVYFLKDKTNYQNVTKYIDDLVEDMDKISELKNKQDFINAVSSVTSKEQDKGMEL